MKVGELVAELTLDTSGMSKGVDKAGKEAQRLAKDLETVNKGGLVAAGALTAIGVAAMEAANRAADYADQIKEVATITGMTTDQVQRWKYAADQSGVSFDALTVTMRMLTQNIQNVDDKNSSLRASLDSLGVSAKTANGQFKDTNTLMLETLTALKNMDDPVRRNTIAMQLYGRSWSELADFMEKDVNLAQLMAKADPISKYKLDQAEAYKNKMNALSSSMDQAAISIGTKLVPALSALVSAFTTYGVPAINSFINTVNTGIDNMVYRALQAGDIINGLFGGALGKGSAAAAWDKYKADMVRAENAANSGSYSDSSITNMPSFSLGDTGSGTGSGTSTTKQWAAQEIYNKYQSGAISKPQLDAMLGKEGLIGAVVQTSGGQYYNTKTGLFSNSYSSAAGTNPYANQSTTAGRMFTDSGIDISGSATQGSFNADPSMALQRFEGWTKQDISGVQSAISTILSGATKSSYKNYYSGEVSEFLPEGVSSLVPTEYMNGRALYGGWMSGQYMTDYAKIDAAKQRIRDIYTAGGYTAKGYGDVESLLWMIEHGNPVTAQSWGAGFKEPVVEAPTVTDYGTSQVSYTSSGAIKSNYSMGISQASNGVLTVNLLLDGKVVAQSVVENLASLGVRV